MHLFDFIHERPDIRSFLHPRALSRCNLSLLIVIMMHCDQKIISSLSHPPSKEHLLVEMGGDWEGGE